MPQKWFKKWQKDKNKTKQKKKEKKKILKNIIMVNPTIHKKHYASWPSWIYPKNWRAFFKLLGQRGTTACGGLIWDLSSQTRDWILATVVKAPALTTRLSGNSLEGYFSIRKPKNVTHLTNKPKEKIWHRSKSRKKAFSKFSSLGLSGIFWESSAPWERRGGRSKCAKEERWGRGPRKLVHPWKPQDRKQGKPRGQGRWYNLLDCMPSV